MARAELTHPSLWMLHKEKGPEFWTNVVGISPAHMNGVTRIVTSSKPNSNVTVSAGKGGGIISWTMREEYNGHRGPLHRERVLAKLTKPGSPTECASASLMATDIALSGGGEYGVSALENGTVTIWDVEYGVPMGSFSTSGSVSSVAISDDNRVIATGSFDDMTVKIWSTQGLLAGCHEQVHAPWNQSKGIAQIKFEPNNYRRLYSCGGKSVALCDVNFGKPSVVGRSSGAVSCMDISNDGKKIAYGGRSPVCGIGEIGVPLKGIGNRMDEVRTHFGPTSALGFSPNGKFLAVGTGVYIVIWRVKDRLRLTEVTNTNVQARPGFALKCTTISWSPDGNYILAGYNDGVIIVIEITDNE